MHIIHMHTQTYIDIQKTHFNHVIENAKEALKLVRSGIISLSLYGPFLFGQFLGFRGCVFGKIIFGYQDKLFTNVCINGMSQN